jgi:large subunit ribosomal protein L19
MADLVKSLEHEQLLDRAERVPVRDLRPGDTVRVYFRIVEGKRERLQPFQGIIIRKREGLAAANITVRRVGAHGVGVERTFPLHSPRLDRIELLRHAHVRRANLHYLRQRTGKRARLREKRRFRSDLEPGAEELQGSS